MKTFFLRLLPYLIALIIGVSLYILADNHIKDESLNGLMMSIAGGLLSVPMIFICYEIVKQRCEKAVKESISDHLYFELNHHVVNVLVCVAKLFKADKIDSETLEKYTQLHKTALKNLIQLNPVLADYFTIEKTAINNIIHNSKSLNALENDDIHTILQISKQAGIIANEIQYAQSQEIKKPIGRFCFNYA